MLARWFARIPGLRPVSSRRDRRRTKPAPPRLRVEVLEDRSVPATITVTSLADNTTADGQVTLREAILAANTDTSVDGSASGAGADTIVFASGLTGTITLNGNQLDITGNLTITGPGADQLAVSGNVASRVLEIGTGVTAFISGLTIRDGIGGTSPTSGGVFFGGGIHNAGTLTLSHMAITGNVAPTGSNPGLGGGIRSIGSLTVIDSVLSGNTSTGDGGAIFGGLVTIRGCTFSNNSAGGNGGGIRVFNASSFADSTFEGNSAGASGGGLYVLSSNGSIVTNCTFLSNSAAGDSTFSSRGGGGLFIAGTTSGTSSTVTASTFSNNSAPNGNGGGILWSPGLSGSIPGLSHCTVTDNTAGRNGGGICISTSATSTVSNLIVADNSAGVAGGGIWTNDRTTIADSTITRNSAHDGGGIFGGGNAFYLVVTNTTVSANAAESRGGGICVDLPTAADGMRAIGITVSGNSANDGGGIWTRSPLEMSNSTIAGNTAAVSGGGVYGISNGQFRNLTVTANRCNTSSSGGSGGGLWLDPAAQSLLLTNTIVAANVSGPAPATIADDVAGAFSTTSAFNLIGVGGSGGLLDRATDPLHNNQVGVAEPGLGALGEYGGPTPTIPLLPGSPAIGRGGKGLAIGGTISIVSLSRPLSGAIMTNDQRGTGFARFFNGTVDIGSYQSELAPPRSTIAVTTTADGGPGSLRQAVQDNNWSGGGNTIAFALPSGATITLTGGELLVVQDVTIAGPGADLLAVSGNHATRVFEIVGYGRFLDAPTNISGLTIKDGSAGPSQTGGGINMREGALIVSNCVFSGNTAESGGGLFHTLGVLTITDTVFSGNSATTRGGGVCVIRPLPRPTGVPSTILSPIIGATFSGNTADSGGGLYTNGGLRVLESTFVGNSSAQDGGAITYRNDVGVGPVLNRLIILNSTLTANTAEGNGGAIAYSMAEFSNGLLIVANSTIAGNIATGTGGGIYTNARSIDQTHLIGVTIANNSAAGGGGVASVGEGLTRMSNTIIARNTAGTEADVSGGFDSLGHNLVGVGEGQVVPNTGDIFGSADLPVNPILGPLGDYGGPTQTIPLLPGSPARGTGSVALAVVPVGFGTLTTDQRGLPRMVDGLIDIGASQTQPRPNETSLPSATGGGVVALEAPEGTTFTAVTAVEPPPPGERAGTGLPNNAELPVGAFDFTLAVGSGATVEVVLYMPTGTVINAYYKHNAATNRWSKFNGASFADRNGDGTSDVVLRLTDGGAGDQNGLIDGVIVDPGVPAFVVPRAVQIDVRSSVSLAGQGLIAAVVLSAADFDAATVEVGSVVFAGASAVHSALEDVNGDGLLDLVLHFRTQDTNLRTLYEQLLADDLDENGILDSNHQEASVNLSGMTSDGDEFEGSDSIDLFLSGRALRDLLDELAASGAI